MTVVLDFYSRQPLSTLQCFKASGADGIARYLTNSMADVRQITKAEVDDAHTAGLAVHFFYEENPTWAGYFTFAQGAEDARQAEARLAELGAPDGTVVYYAVDTNIDPNLTVAYFNGVESATTPKSIPGGYGYQRFCEFAHSQFPNVGKHLAQTYGAPTVPLDLFQHLQETRCGVSVDVNDCAADGWRKETKMATPKYAGQSTAVVNVVVGKVAECNAEYDYGQGPRAIPFKVYATEPGFWPIIFYPPADPDSDPTEVLNAQPALFVMAARAAE